MLLSGEILFNSIEINTLTKIDSTNLITISSDTNSNYSTDFCKYENILSTRYSMCNSKNTIV